MPCNDGGWGENQHHQEVATRLNEAEAMLCCVVRALETADSFHSVLYHADWERAGTTYDDLTKWWKAHQAKDARTVAEKAAAEKLAKTKSKALAKLTAAERKALDLE